MAKQKIKRNERTKVARQKPRALVFTLLAVAAMAQAAAPNPNPGILALRPVGYWPANEGAGEVLHDASPQANHGRIHHVGWSGGMLDFRGGYHWLEIPSQGALRSADFSVGGWVFLREPVGGSWRNLPGRTGMTLFGNANVQGRPWMGGDSDGFGLFVRWNQILEVSVGRRRDALKTRDREFDLGRGQMPALGFWHHLLLTYDSVERRMRLYLNGELLADERGVNYTPSNRSFYIGPDADWWFQSNTPGSLNGSVRDLVFFDRALDGGEVGRLAKISHPLLNPPCARQQVVSADDLLRVIELADADPAAQARAVIQLTDLGEAAAPHIPRLAQSLLDEVEQNGMHLPRIEEFYRNALIRALLRSGCDSAVVQQALRRALFEPLEAIPSPEEPRRVLSQGDRLRDARPRGPSENVRAYTPQAERDGIIYKVGTGVPWEGVEKVSPAEFREISARWAREYPDAADWRKPDFPHLYRIPLTRIGPDGTSKTIYLEGPDFVIDGHDQKLHGWSIAIDNDGYIHLTGAMHNSPNPGYFIPGSWERLGLPRDQKNPGFPRAMVWVSTRPHDLESLVFVGQQDNPLCPPAPDGLNYMNFVQDRAGELYLYSRIGVSGIQSWGLYRYHTQDKRWTAIGGQAHNVIADVLAANPEWNRFLERSWGHVRTPETGGPQTLAWAWQPHFYNYCRDPRGVEFDLENRMHVWVRLFAIGAEGQHLFRRLYAFSDDGGTTFRRVDGSPVSTPLTLNPASTHLADATADQAEMWWQLWISLFHQAGCIAE